MKNPLIKKVAKISAIKVQSTTKLLALIYANVTGT